MASAENSYDCSQDLFEEEQATDEDHYLCGSSSISQNVPILKSLLKTANCNLLLKPLSISRLDGHGEFHTICVELGKYQPNTIPKPFRAGKNTNSDLWDENHVRMPFSSKNCFPINGPQGKEIRERWQLVKEAFENPIESSHDLENRIKSYNLSNWDFRGLHDFFKYHLDEEGDAAKQFFETIIPKMVDLMMKTKELILQPLPMLKAGTSGSITLSQLQVAALLVNAFFCTFPRRNVRTRNDKIHEYRNYPDINFNRLFQKSSDEYHPEKFKCLFNYFRSVLLVETPKGLITFTRRKVNSNNLPEWSTQKSKLLEVSISEEGRIEDAPGTLQVDFANAMVGGGVLGHGCVQEEIRFLTCPELILSRLFTERLEDLEVLIITGFQCFNDYNGYGRTFEFSGSHKDETLFQSTAGGPRRLSYLVAMDALYFHDSTSQYTKENIDRELNKAFVAFDSSLEDLTDTSHPVSISTGNWGCGAFRGDPQLKSIIQMMAASLQRRHLIYFTFHDKKLETSIREVHNFLQRKMVSVGDLYKKLITYGETAHQTKFRKDLFQYIFEEFSYRPKTVLTEPIPKVSEEKSYSSPKRLRKEPGENLMFDQNDELELSNTKSQKEASQKTNHNVSGRLHFDEALERSLPKIKNSELGKEKLSYDSSAQKSSAQEKNPRKDSQKSIQDYFFKS